MSREKPQLESVKWFIDYYDKTVMNPPDDWPKEWRAVEILQIPGETVFVPQGINMNIYE